MYQYYRLYTVQKMPTHHFTLAHKFLADHHAQQQSADRAILAHREVWFPAQRANLYHYEIHAVSPDLIATHVTDC